MITKLRISNFYSIGDSTELDFTKGGKGIENGYLLYKKGKISTVNGFYGANASGKTTFLSAINTLLKIIYNKNPIQALGITPTESKFISPNLHSDYKNKPSLLGFDILLKNKLYRYDVEILDGSTIKKETLYVTDLSIKSHGEKEVFSRKGQSIVFGPDFKDHDSYFSVVKLPDNQTLLSHLIESFPAGQDFRDYKDKFFLKIGEADLMMPGIAGLVNRAIRINNLDNVEKKEVLELTTKVMRQFDETIKNIDINIDNNNINISVEHKGFSGPVGMGRESAGTRELFIYIYDILKVLKEGGIVVYDETNRYFHPEIENILISLFKNTEINVSTAQLFFASHNHDTLDILNLDQIFIVEKGKCSSIAYKVSDIDDIKNRDNLKKKYNLGLLGGVPDVIDFKHAIKQFI